MNPDSEPWAALLEKLPADDYATAQQVCKELLAGGPAVVVKLAQMVGEPGDKKGIKPHYALHGLVAYTGRPGAEAERKQLAATLAAQLATDLSDEVKSFLVEQLRLCAGPDEVPALATLLHNDRLCEPAAQALQSIGGPAALKALRAAQKTAAGKRKATVDQAVEILSRSE